jgi:hypothetical protein
MSRSLLALPCSRMCAGSNPAASAQRLGGEVHVGAGMAPVELLAVLARGRAQGVLVDHERGRPELLRHVRERAAADRQPPVGGRRPR